MEGRRRHGEACISTRLGFTTFSLSSRLKLQTAQISSVNPLFPSNDGCWSIVMGRERRSMQLQFCCLGGRHGSGFNSPQLFHAMSMGAGALPTGVAGPVDKEDSSLRTSSGRSQLQRRGQRRPSASPVSAADSALIAPGSLHPGFPTQLHLRTTRLSKNRETSSMFRREAGHPPAPSLRPNLPCRLLPLPASVPPSSASEGSSNWRRAVALAPILPQGRGGVPSALASASGGFVSTPASMAAHERLPYEPLLRRRFASGGAFGSSVSASGA